MAARDGQSSAPTKEVHVDEIAEARTLYPDHSIIRWIDYTLGWQVLIAIPRTAKALKECLFFDGETYRVWPLGEVEHRLKSGSSVLASLRSQLARSGSQSLDSSISDLKGPQWKHLRNQKSSVIGNSPKEKSD